MRPVSRGISPQAGDFVPYTKALEHLIGCIGRYCSYCERNIQVQLAVEHIQPKGGKYGQPHLLGRWDNYLLACVNCNSTKRDKQLVLANVLLPDRDNTFAAFAYLPDGTVQPAEALTPVLRDKARETLALTGLDKKGREVFDQNGKMVALDRGSQRKETWLHAKEAKADIDADPGNYALRRNAVKLAKAEGFFSVWMTVFGNELDMQNRLIDAFEGTRGSGCFDPATARSISPAPNPDKLADGAKI
jgi:uncharacterized protein (TIGR02646 family)